MKIEYHAYCCGARETPVTFHSIEAARKYLKLYACYPDAGYIIVRMRCEPASSAVAAIK